MTRIILIGYMGAGKTTVGKALSKELGIPFYDLDWYIESRRRKTIPQLFAELGEEGFRNIERNMLHEVAEFEDVIISCGGGTPCFFDNIDYMNQQGQVVYLHCEPEVLHKHLLMGKTERPLPRRAHRLHPRAARLTRTVLQQGCLSARRVADGQLREDKNHRREAAGTS